MIRIKALSEENKHKINNAIGQTVGFGLGVGATAGLGAGAGAIKGYRDYLPKKIRGEAITKADKLHNSLYRSQLMKDTAKKWAKKAAIVGVAGGILKRGWDYHKRKAYQRNLNELYQ